MKIREAENTLKGALVAVRVFRAVFGPEMTLIFADWKDGYCPASPKIVFSLGGLSHKIGINLDSTFRYDAVKATDCEGFRLSAKSLEKRLQETKELFSDRIVGRQQGDGT